MVVQENNYDPWGLSFGSATESQIPKGITNRFQYNGKEKIADMDLGWSDYGARMYDPSIGRWNVVDPLTESQENWGVYHYVYDNPVLNTDPDGREPCCQGVLDYLSGLADAFMTNNAPVSTNYIKKNGNSNYKTGVKAGNILSIGTGATEVVAGILGDLAAGVGEIATVGVATPVAVPVATGSTTMILHGGATVIKAFENLNSEGQSNSEPGSRRKNWIGDTGEPNSIATNPSGTTTKKYGPDGRVQKEYNKGHSGEKTPEVERKGLVHDHIPKRKLHPKNPKDTERQPGRAPKRNELKKDFGL